MDRIEAVIQPSLYEHVIDLLQFKINDKWLDRWLDEVYPDNLYAGLIPALHLMYSYKDSEVVWSRIIPEQNKTTICPVLMCPDDCDFSCTIIVAEIKRLDYLVEWNRLGINMTRDADSNAVGNLVEWLPEFPSLIFSYDEYSKTIEIFREVYEEDKRKDLENLKRSL
jgi:hypothetical protein